MTEESARALRHRSEQLASLASIGAFKMLVTETVQKRGRMVESLMQRLLRGESLESLQRQVDYDRGFIDGMAYAVTGVPAGAASKLERTQKQLEQDLKDEPERDLWSYEQPE